MRKLTIEQMQALAKKRGGECLSTTYVNKRTKLLWRCLEGHEWEATQRLLRQGERMDGAARDHGDVLRAIDLVGHWARLECAARVVVE